MQKITSNLSGSTPLSLSEIWSVLKHEPTWMDEWNKKPPKKKKYAIFLDMK